MTSRRSEFRRRPKTGRFRCRLICCRPRTRSATIIRPKVPRRCSGRLDLIGLHGKRNETQGLFIYRHDRLIKWGGWHQMWDTNDEKTKLARVDRQLRQGLDDALKINISKQIVQLPQQLQAEIKKIADVARRDSQKKYRKERRLPPPTADSLA